MVDELTTQHLSNNVISATDMENEKLKINEIIDTIATGTLDRKNKHTNLAFYENDLELALLIDKDSFDLTIPPSSWRDYEFSENIGGSFITEIGFIQKYDSVDISANSNENIDAIRAYEKGDSATHKFIDFSTTGCNAFIVRRYENTSTVPSRFYKYYKFTLGIYRYNPTPSNKRVIIGFHNPDASKNIKITEIYMRGYS